MDPELRPRWEDYTRAREGMPERNHILEAPWWLLPADNKKQIRHNCISHFLDQIPCQEVEQDTVTLPERQHYPDYLRHPVPDKMIVPQKY